MILLRLEYLFLKNVRGAPLKKSLTASKPSIRVLVYVFKKNLNASKPSEHPPQVEECLKV